MELKYPPLFEREERNCVLIAPYGIEMSPRSRQDWKRLVLIAPYGIEISARYNGVIFLLSFNSTLWN